MQSSASLIKSIKISIVIFIVALLLSGATAFALETELAWLNDLIGRKRAHYLHGSIKFI